VQALYILNHNTTTTTTTTTMTVPVPPPGVFVPVPTFFHPSAEASSASQLQAKVDVTTQVHHSVFLAKAGIAGLVLLGSTGEAIHLNRRERADLVAGVRAGLDAAGFPDYPIMAGVLTNGIDETLEWLRDYHAAGAQWGLVLVPGYFGAGASQDNIREWYTVVADNSPIPILMYCRPPNPLLLFPREFISKP
jgi:2-keto-3-deoxy-L-rhamnonate aldolase